MSDGDDIPSETMGDLRDGQLQIVEVAPYQVEVSPSQQASDNQDSMETVEIDTQDGTKLYIDGPKGIMHLDLLNWTLVRCEEDGEGTYKLVSNAESAGSEFVTPDSVTCVLQSSDGEENEAQEAYVMVEGEAEQEYVMLQTGSGPVVYLDQPPAPPPPPPPPKEEKDQMTAEMILQRAKALQKAKRLLTESLRPRRGPGRRRRRELPSPAALLASPAFRLFLYGCKQCGYRCNAMKDLAAHRLEHHGAASKPRAGPSRTRAPPAPPAPRPLRCSRCPYTAAEPFELMRHIQDTHDLTEDAPADDEPAVATYKECRLSELSSLEDAARGSLLVCGACGHEASAVDAFRRHVAAAHARAV